MRSINRLLVLSFINGHDDPTRDDLDEYDMLLVEVKDFNALTNDKPSFYQPVKTNKKLLKQLAKCQEATITWQEI